MSHWFMWRHKQRERFLVFAQLKLGDYTLKIQVGGSKAYLHATIRRRHDLYSSDDKDKTTVTPLSRPKTTSNEEEVSTIAESVKADPDIFKYELQSLHSWWALSIWISWAVFIWENSLQGGYRTNWQTLTYLLHLFELNGPEHKTNVVISDEAWMHFCGIASKRWNAFWLGPEDKDIRSAKPDFQSKKRLFWIFFGNKRPVEVDVLAEKSTFTGTYYTETVLFKLVQEM